MKVVGTRSAGDPRDAASGRATTHARNLQQAGGGSSSGGLPPLQQAVPVILAVGPGTGAVALNASDNTAVDAGLLNTTGCIRLAAGEDDSTPDQQPVLAALNGTAGQPYERPPLDLQGCAASVTPVATNSSNIVVQVGGRYEQAASHGMLR